MGDDLIVFLNSLSKCQQFIQIAAGAMEKGERGRETGSERREKERVEEKGSEADDAREIRQCENTGRLTDLPNLCRHFLFAPLSIKFCLTEVMEG